MLKKLEGVDASSVSVTLIPPRAVLIHNSSIIPELKVKLAIEDMGYDVPGFNSDLVPAAGHEESSEDSYKPVTSTLFVSGMTCASCVSAIESGLSTHPGVESVTVNLLMHQAKITYHQSLIGIRDLIEAIENLGYGATLPSTHDLLDVGNSFEAQELQSLYYRFLISLIFAIPTFFISMVVMMMLPPNNPLSIWFMTQIVPGMTISDLSLLILATPVQFGLGYRFFKGAYKALFYSKVANVGFRLL
jgi:Cu+-exporting ATPase